MLLYDNPFSPFCRKVRMVLRYKGLAFESLDALALEHAADLAAVNPRFEVPVLQDGEVTVANSADIVAYLEHRHPEPPVYPVAPARRVAARAWERLSDSQVDAIIHDISIWTWATLEPRPDAPPPGLVETGIAELRGILDRLEGAIGDGPFLCGELSIADIALWPHLAAVHLFGLAFTAERWPGLRAWKRRMRALPICEQDVADVRRGLETPVEELRRRYENRRIKWRGDRLEWLLSRGFHAWWAAELAAGRVEWPLALQPQPAS